MSGLNINKLYYNIVVIVVFIAFAYVFTHGLEQMTGALSSLDQNTSLDPKFLPEYLLRTGMRFFIAIWFSAVTAVIYATVAVKNTRIRAFLIPLLDIFQSIPVLGYISFTVTAFVAMAPGSIVGVELAVIFAVFTAQVWNMIFSVYQSLVTVPPILYEVAKIYKLNAWQTFWKIELPFATPGLVWNIILSMAASWFYIVAQEVITVGAQSYTMPGIGAYIALALKNMDIKAIFYVATAMASLIFIFNELFFKPMVSWSYKFRYEFNVGANAKCSSILLDYLQRASICNIIIKPAQCLFNYIFHLKFARCISKNLRFISIVIEIIFWSLVLWALMWLCGQLYTLCSHHLSANDVLTTFHLGGITMLRVTTMLLFASMIWVPVGIFIGLRPKIASKIQPIVQFMTALPANLYYPIFVTAILHFQLHQNIWLSVMIVAGSQWYILYNVISGAQTIPTELLEASAIFKLRTLSKVFKIILPGILPYYITGLITAAGASWNASIIAEVITWGNTTLMATGLGSYITTNTTAGNFAQIALGIITMSVFVVSINHFILQPVYKFASIKFRLDV